jgi:hypothetical protein
MAKQPIRSVSSRVIATLLLVLVALGILITTRTASNLSISPHSRAGSSSRYTTSNKSNTKFQCKSTLEFVPLHARGQPVLLASYPGSGNTWMRELIQRGTGLVTGSAYRDASLQGQGFPGEKVRDGSVIVVSMVNMAVLKDCLPWQWPHMCPPPI